ncbi:MAG: TetR/AcrR family transcriptional regulator, partial [Actinomycetota bacterium]
RPGDSDTRTLILDAARRTFAREGYQRATIRTIATGAGVDPALVHHYFGRKEDLFVSAVQVPFSPAAAVEGVFGPGLEGAGERLAHLFFSVWEAEPSRESLLGQLRRAMADSGPPAPLVEFIRTALLPRMGAHLRVPDRELAVELAMSHLLGLAIVRYVLRLEPLASTPIEVIISQVAPRIQSYLDSSAPRSIS